MMKDDFTLDPEKVLSEILQKLENENIENIDLDNVVIFVTSAVENYLKIKSIHTGLESFYNQAKDNSFTMDQAKQYITEEENKAKAQNDVVFKGFIKSCNKALKMPKEEALEHIKNALYNLHGQNIEEMLSLMYKRPSALTMPITKVSNHVFTVSDDQYEAINVNVGSKKKKFIVPTQLFVAIDDEEGITLPGNLTPEDREVMNGICSIVASNQSTFTAKQVYDAYAGKGTTSTQAIEKVEKSIDKLRTTLISIDWTEHAKMKGILQEGDKLKYSENLLHAKSVTYINNGQKVTGYQLLEDPILYRYAKSVDQICSVDRNLLNVNVSNTQEIILIKNYMLRHIEKIKNQKSRNTKAKDQSPTVKFDTMFKYCQIIEPNRTQAKRLRDSAFQILDEWQEKGHIKAYKKKYDPQHKQIISGYTIEI